MEIDFNTASAVEELSFNDLILSPNPMIEEMQITFPLADEEVSTLQISNAQGQLVLTIQSTDTTVSIDSDKLSTPGVYILTLHQDGNTIQKKFVVL